MPAKSLIKSNSLYIPVRIKHHNMNNKKAGGEIKRKVQCDFQSQEQKKRISPNTRLCRFTSIKEVWGL